MSQTTTREERRSALDDFAQSTGSPPATVPAAVFAPPVDQAHGAMALAVHRDESTIFRKLKTLAAAAGTDWYYRWPVKNRRENRIDWVEGPSIKLANDLARIYGNNDVDVRVQDFGDGWLFHARFIDLESGFSLTRPFQQRKSGGTMGDDAERRRDIAFQIGASKAIRNVVVNALQTFADFAFEEAREALVDKIGTDIERWRQKTVERTSALVELARVEAVIGRVSKDWLAPDIARVIAMMKAIADGMASLDETFPTLRSSEEAGKEKTAAALDQFASAGLSSGPSSGANSPSAPAAGGGEGFLQQASAAADASEESPAADATLAAAGEGSGDPEPPSPTSPLPPPELVEGSTALRKEAIDKLLAIAADPQLSVEEKLENLDTMQPIWAEQLESFPGFVKVLFETVAKVIRKELPKAAAQKYLQGLKL